MLRRLAAELIAEIRHLDRRIAAATGDITAAVAASNSTLTELCGIADLTAGVSSDDRARDRLPGLGPPAQLLSAHHGDHPDPPRHPDELITSANARLGRATKKPCAV